MEYHAKRFLATWCQAGCEWKDTILQPWGINAQTDDLFIPPAKGQESVSMYLLEWHISQITG